MAPLPCTNDEDQFSPHSCTLANGLPCGDCKEALSLENHISEVIALLKTLEAKRPQLRSRMNARHDALTSKLPVEVMSNIFIKFLEQSDQQMTLLEYPHQQSLQRMSLEWSHVDLKKYANHWIPSDNGESEGEGPFRVREPSQLGCICNSWRAIAWSTPQLWTTIAVDIDCRDLNLDFIEQLARRLARSKTLPLHILISSAGMEDCEVNLLNGIVIRILEEFLAHSSRWASLFINGFMYNIAQHLRCDDQARAKLRHLDLHVLDFDYLPRTKLTINAAWEHLTHITTSGLTFAQIDIDWSNLTHVSVTDLHRGEYFKILALARRLSHFQVVVIWDESSNHDAYPEKVAMQHDTLRYLDLDIPSTAAADVLRYATFPALESYRYRSQGDGRRIHEVIGDTFNLSSGKSLRTLIIKESKSPTIDEVVITSCDELIMVLKALPALEYLDLDIYGGDSHYFEPLFKLLSASRCSSGATAEDFLPNLKELWLRIQQGISWALVPQIFGPSITTQISHSVDIQAHPVKPAPHQRPLRFLGVDGLGLMHCHINRKTVLQFMSLMDKGITFRIGNVEEGGFNDMLDASIRFHHLAH